MSVTEIEIKNQKPNLRKSALEYTLPFGTNGDQGAEIFGKSNLQYLNQRPGVCAGGVQDWEYNHQIGDKDNTQTSKSRLPQIANSDTI